MPLSSKYFCRCVLLVWSALWSLTPASAQMREGEWSLATFNVRYDNPGDPLTWEERRDQVAQIVGFYDVVGIQEALPNQVEDLASRLPWMAHVGRGRDADGGGEACPIFYDKNKWELLHSQTLWLARDWKTPGAVHPAADLPRIVTVATLHHKADGKTLRVYNTHWSHVSVDAREFAGDFLAVLDAACDADATALLGDFNEVQASPGRMALSDAGFVNTYDNPKVRCRHDFPTYTTFKPEGSAGGPRIDAVYVKGLEATWTCVDEVIVKGLFISDHMPVHAVVKWNLKEHGRP